MTDESENLIEVRDLTFSRGHRKIFDHLNLTIKRGEVTALMGPSGTGKTTLLRLITRQLIPDSGQILVDGVDIATLNRVAVVFAGPTPDYDEYYSFTIQGGGSTPST